MIDIETIEFIAFLNKMAEKAKNGVIPFSGATPEDLENAVAYDDKATVPTKEDCYLYPLVCDFSIDTQHHDIVSYWGDAFPGVEVYARQDFSAYAGSDPYLYIRISGEEKSIIVEDGDWYIA